MNAAHLFGWTNMNLATKMSLELLAISMIGDGMLALTQPRRHMRLWNAGPEPWRRLCTYFEERPAQTMLVGAAFVGLGLWLASRQDQEHEASGMLEDRSDGTSFVAPVKRDIVSDQTPA